MFWILPIVSSIWLGYELIPFLKVRDLNIMMRIFSGWLLGVQITAMALYVINFIIPFNFVIVLIISGGEIAGSLVLHKKGQKSTLSFEKAPWFIAFIAFVAGCSFKHLSGVYKLAPEQSPTALTPIMDRELSFIHSVLYGLNNRRRNVLFYADPMISGKYYYGYSLPLLYTASLMSTGLSYSGASIVICFINTMATAFSIFNFAKKYTRWPALAAFVYMFSGSWAGFLYFKAANRLNPNNDLVHQLSKSHTTVWYHLFGYLLSLSKATSFTIAYSQYSIFWMPSDLSAIFAACCPSVASSAALFATLFGMQNENKMLIGCTLTLILRIFPFDWTYKPLFREAEMRGTFFAPIVIWWVGLGPIFTIIAVFFWVLPKSTFKYYFLSTVGPFLLLNFFREGNDHLQNSLAIACTLYPLSIVAFVELMRRFINWPDDEENKGIAAFFMTFTIAFLLFGGFIVSRRLEFPRQYMISDEDKEAIQWLRKIPKDSIVYGSPKQMSPIAVSGRQQFLGNKHELFALGVNIKKRLEEVSQLSTEDINVWKQLKITHVLAEPVSSIVAPDGCEEISRNAKYSLCKIPQ
ncbi:hypothetical protein TVAG_486110 [Trichomonas vaginalis G3]|uniref:Uncharacterized protein n=1 Tax=Trichomonas vaginalis (strain ATCC PRA-98 / G3) TaxID=412133 RepID=A2EEF8_TRIV3|nr:hypothetical protein TVAGG3_0691310 [Trichomonas vaginalis G3]EAY08964.1 hypothetical protein TVAG_486110 [Trichomonas vaginalis G3]KAI5508587.1 hypothetical protein TVAGG3_0691310 [Trichomonas vaginalis G3]|eukprot:XP_001321187.1 hypothetical protein [Trichomonas vaginalis G3]